MRVKRPFYFLPLLFLPLPLFVFMQNPSWASQVHGAALSVIKPVFLAGDALSDGIRNSGTALSRFWNTFQNQGVYEARIAELENELRQYNETVKENERLKKLFDFRQTFSSKTIAARVIGADPSPWRKILFLDKGTKQGLKSDMPVIVPEGLVGRIIEAGPSVSKLLLLTDPNARIAGLGDTSRAQGVVAGQGNEKLLFSYLELESGVSVGETVLTSGTSELFPKGLRIGKIVSMSKDATSLHLQAEIESYVQFSKLEEVLCLISSRSK